MSGNLSRTLRGHLSRKLSENMTMHAELHDVLKIAAGALIALTIRGVFVFAFEIVQEMKDDPKAIRIARWLVGLSLLAGAAVLWFALAPG